MSVAERRRLAFRSNAPIGADPDVCASIVWHVVKMAAQRNLQVVELTIQRMAVFVEVEMPKGATDEKAYLEYVGAMLQGAIVKGAREGQVHLRIDTTALKGPGG